MAQVDAFHRKYRPKTISEYVGNVKLKQTVRGMLSNGNRPQVILLEGHSGCGKTTMARLLAKEYCCEHRTDDTGACGTCADCEAFNEYIETGESGGLMHLREIDSAKVGKAEAESIMAEMSAPSYDGGWKTFIFDESHLLTAAAMGGLLKMVEEPPEKVLIIFCTTDPDKMLDTLLSRCQYVLKVAKPTREDLCTLLLNVCKAEGVKCDAKGINLVCTAGDFVPRNALTALESVVKGKGDVTYSNAAAVLNAIADEHYFKFYELLTSETVDIYKYIGYLSDLKATVDMNQFIDGLISYTKRGLYVYNGIQVEGVDGEEMRQYRKVFSAFRTKDIAYVLSTLIDIQKAPDIEVRLLLLGYTGLFKPVVETVERTAESISPGTSTVSKEQQLNSDIRNATLVPTAEDIEKITETVHTTATMDTVMNMFDVTKYTGNISDFD